MGAGTVPGGSKHWPAGLRVVRVGQSVLGSTLLGRVVFPSVLRGSPESKDCHASFRIAQLAAHHRAAVSASTTTSTTAYQHLTYRTRLVSLLGPFSPTDRFIGDREPHQLLLLPLCRWFAIRSYIRVRAAPLVRAQNHPSWAYRTQTKHVRLSQHCSTLSNSRPRPKARFVTL